MCIIQACQLSLYRCESRDFTTDLKFSKILTTCKGVARVYFFTEALAEFIVQTWEVMQESCMLYARDENLLRQLPQWYGYAPTSSYSCMHQNSKF